MIDKEKWLYLLFGILSVAINTLLYMFLCNMGKMDALLANIFSWVVAVIFSYLTNRFWVFKSKIRKGISIFKEMACFFGSRLFTLGLEELLLYIGIFIMGGNRFFVKASVQGIVVILNYFLSKKIVFYKNNF